MPQIKSAKKRVRVTARQTVGNRLHRTRSRTALKSVRSLLASGDVAGAVAHFPIVQKYLDKAAKTNAMHPNTAARSKSRLATAIKEAGNKTPLAAVAAAAPTKTTKKTAMKKPVAKAAPKKAPAKVTKTAAAKPAAKPAPKKPAAKKAALKKTG